MSAEQELLEMIKSKKAYPSATIMSLFEQLDPVPAEFMIGTWYGGKFDGGLEPNPINWCGKRFVSSSHVEPMLCRKEDGTVYAWEKWGVAQLREVAFGGKVQATLIYDTLPMMDYFRKVTKDIVIGLGDIKGRPTDFFFWLERQK
jgi:hypothetical protein